MSNTESADWSLITVTFNSAERLRACWSDADLGAAEWIVVDNASSDDSAAAARSLGARVIELDRNLGFGAANNVGLCAVNRRWVAFVNPDVKIPDPSGLKRLALISELNGALVAPQLLNPDGSEQPNGRGLPFLIDKVAHRAVRLPGSRVADYSRIGLTRPTYVAWAMGAAIVGLRQTFRDLEGWDERFFLYYEDHDLGLRAWRAGVPVVLDPSVRWTHEWQRATKRLAWRPWKHEITAGSSFYRRYSALLSRAGFRSSALSSLWMTNLASTVWTAAEEPVEPSAKPGV